MCRFILCHNHNHWHWSGMERGFRQSLCRYLGCSLESDSNGASRLLGISARYYSRSRVAYRMHGISRRLPSNCLELFLVSILIWNRHPAKIGSQVGDSSSGRTTDSGSVSRGSNPRSPASRSVVWRIRLAAKDITLSRWRPRVRIPYALPTSPSGYYLPTLPEKLRLVIGRSPDALPEVASQELAAYDVQVSVGLALHSVPPEVR